MPGKTHRTNHIIMVADSVMRAANIGLCHEELVTAFATANWFNVYDKIHMMSAKTQASIVSYGLAPGGHDTSTDPHRKTGWASVNPIVTCDLSTHSGAEVVKIIATATIIAAIWDILQANQKQVITKTASTKT